MSPHTGAYVTSEAPSDADTVNSLLQKDDRPSVPRVAARAAGGMLLAFLIAFVAICGMVMSPSGLGTGPDDDVAIGRAK